MHSPATFDRNEASGARAFEAAQPASHGLLKHVRRPAAPALRRARTARRASRAHGRHFRSRGDQDGGNLRDARHVSGLRVASACPGWSPDAEANAHMQILRPVALTLPIVSGPLHSERCILHSVPCFHAPCSQKPGRVSPPPEGVPDGSGWDPCLRSGGLLVGRLLLVPVQGKGGVPEEARARRASPVAGLPGTRVDSCDL